MNNFIYENKTKVIFGKGCAKEYLTCLLKKYGDNVMFAYGGGSIKENGIYDEIMSYLNAAERALRNLTALCRIPLMPKCRRALNSHRTTKST